MSLNRANAAIEGGERVWCEKTFGKYQTLAVIQLNVAAFIEIIINMVNIVRVILRWISCGPGYLARSRLGVYMVYQSFDFEMGTHRWFAKFETKGQWIDFEAFDSPTMRSNLATTTMRRSWTL